MGESADGELLKSIRVVIRLARIAQQACEEGGLTLAQYRALNSAAKSGQRAYELARNSAISRPAVSALTNGMVKAGLVERCESDDDGRGVIFHITDHGLKTLRTAERLLVGRFDQVLGGATEALAALDDGVLDAALDIQVGKDFGPKTR